MRKRFTLALLSLLLVPLAMMAQNVTIRANNGSTIAAIKNGGAGDTFFQLGGFATWQHEQLNMVMTVSDGTKLTPNGQLDNPANNLFTNGNYMQIAKGQVNNANVCYVTISLPSGYRFTGYNIKFTKPADAQGGEFNDYQLNTRFGETNSTFSTYTTSATIATGGDAQTIKRSEGTSGGMGNVLYFKLENTRYPNYRSLIQLESAEFFFTSEENYSPVTPAGEITSPVSAVDIPFPTSKVDFGPIERRQGYGGGYRISYSSANVTDLQGKFVLYEAESTKDGTDIDGISGKIVDYKAGTISSSGGYFKLGSGDATKEQVYYIETPTYVTLSNGVNNPVGYRIVGAQFDYTISASNSFYIQYTYNGTKYYLNTAGRFTTTPVIWEIDEDGYISSNGSYLYWDNGYAATQTTKPGSGERFTIADNGRIYQTEYTSYYVRFYNQNGTYYGLITNNNNGYYATTEPVASSGTDGFTLYVYDKEGANPEEIAVTGTGSKTLTGLNNDAVKFGVKGTGLVRATLTLQALDPYLDEMTVWCNDKDNSEVKMHQTFTASDFSVNGGEFFFNVPIDTKNVAITFEDLQSQYFDETYPKGSASHTSRLNFVKSEHYNMFGESNNNIYSNVSEAKNATKERRKVSIVGSAPFKFNNADEVGTQGGTLTEYPFSLEKYAASPNNGSFGTMEYAVTEEDQVDTRYVFTTDETRYNIAPTTATQHRAYAFYKMIVHVQSKTYEPKIEVKKVYNSTLYGTGATDAFYGVEVTAPYVEGGETKQGFASTKDIFEGIERILKTDKVDDFGHTDLPADANKLLYLDFSKLAGVYQVTTDSHQSMDDYSATNAANCLIFLPVGASAPNNNVAYKMQSGTFVAAHDIVLTDKEPFFSPYDIQLNGESTAYYDRQITTPQYDKVSSASIIMPFQLTVDAEGVHNNEDHSQFSLHTMQEVNSIALIDGSTYAYFPIAPTTEFGTVSVTAPNTPYLVKVISNTSENGSFVVSQKNATIAATAGENYNNSNYTFTGTHSTASVTGGTVSGSNVTFTPTGTFAGQAVPKANNIFYFANNEFVNSADYKYDAPIKIAPFRAYFATGGLTASANLHILNIVFGEGIGDEPNGIDTLSADVDVDVNAPVFDLQGRKVADGLQNAHLVRGIYVINGVKVIVK